MKCKKCGTRRVRRGHETCKVCEARALDALVAFAFLSDPKVVGKKMHNRMRKAFDAVVGADERKRR